MNRGMSTLLSPRMHTAGLSPAIKSHTRINCVLEKFSVSVLERKKKNLIRAYWIYTDVEVLMALRSNSNSEALQYAMHLLPRQTRTACLFLKQIKKIHREIK